jgi:hypothetical protein
LLVPSKSLSPFIAGALMMAVAVVLVSDFTWAITFVLVFETFFPLFQNRSPAIAIVPVGIALLAVLMASAAWNRFTTGLRGGFSWTAVDYAVGVFVVACLIGAFVSGNTAVALGGIRDQLKYFLVYLAVRCAGPALSRTNADRIGQVILCLLLLIAAVGVLQFFVEYSFLAEFARLPARFAQQYMGLGRYSLDGGAHFIPRPRRVYSLLASPLYTGYASMGGVLFAAVLYQYRVIPRWAAAIFFEICAVCLFLTYTRSAMVGLFVGLLVFATLFFRRSQGSRADKVRFVSSLGAGLVMLAVFLAIVDPALVKYPLTVFNRNASITNGHYEFLRKDVEHMIAHPLGSGTGSSSMAIRSLDPRLIKIWTESWYFYVGAELGLSGLAVYLVICGLALSLLFRAARFDTDGGLNTWRAIGTALWFTGLLGAGIAGVPFFSWMLSAAVWASIALVVNESTVVAHSRDRKQFVSETIERGGTPPVSLRL